MRVTHSSEEKAPAHGPSSTQPADTGPSGTESEDEGPGAALSIGQADVGGCLGRRAPATQGTGRCLLLSAGVLLLLESGEGYGRKSPDKLCFGGSVGRAPSCVRCGPWILLLGLSLEGALRFDSRWVTSEV